MIRNLGWNGGAEFAASNDAAGSSQTHQPSHLIAAHVPASTDHGMPHLAHPIHPIIGLMQLFDHWDQGCIPTRTSTTRSEEHTSELQSRFDLVCRLLLEKKKY